MMDDAMPYDLAIKRWNVCEEELKQLKEHHELFKNEVALEFTKLKAEKEELRKCAIEFVINNCPHSERKTQYLKSLDKK